MTRRIADLDVPLTQLQADLRKLVARQRSQEQASALGEYLPALMAQSDDAESAAPYPTSLEAS